MNKLETKLSEFMKPMLLDSATTTLDDTRQILLATWIIKTAMVHEFTDPARQTYFARYERRHVKRWLLPPNDVWIWIGHYINSTSLSHTFPVYLMHGERPTVYSLTLTAGRFVCQVLAYRRRKWKGVQRLDGTSPPESSGLA